MCEGYGASVEGRGNTLSEWIATEERSDTHINRSQGAGVLVFGVVATSLHGSRLPTCEPVSLYEASAMCRRYFCYPGDDSKVSKRGDLFLHVSV